MNKTMLCVVIFLLGASLFASCLTQGDSTKNPNIIQNQPLPVFVGDTFHTDIQKYKNGAFVEAYFITKEISKKMNLDSLGHGFDSVQFRIWVHSSISDSISLIVIRNKAFAWEAQLFRIKPYAHEDRQKLDSVKWTTETLYPKFGWIIFREVCRSLYAIDSIDISKVLAKAEVYGRSSITFEFASRASYRLYDISLPISKSVLTEPKSDIRLVVRKVISQLGVMDLMNIEL